MPTDADIHAKRQIAFSIFYTAAVTFPFVVTIASWSFLDPLKSSVRSAWPRPLVLFIIANFNGVNSAIALLEVMILSSVPKQQVKPILESRDVAETSSCSLYPSRLSASA